MLNPQELREKTFEKAVFGGYDMGAVDDFIESISGDIAALQKENATLKSKMKLLVDKIEEYRGTESIIQRTLLTAQKTSGDMEKETRERCEAMLAEAKEQADAIVSDSREDVKVEEAKLAAARKSTAEFIDKMRQICTTQLTFYDELADLRRGLDDKPAQREEILSAVKSIEDSVARIADIPAPAIDIAPPPEPPAPEEEFDVSGFNDEEPAKQFFADGSIPDNGETRKYYFDNLRFGDSLK